MRRGECLRRMPHACRLAWAEGYGSLDVRIFRVRDPNAALEIEVMDYDLASHDDFLGSAKIEVSEIVPGKPIRTWVRLWDEDLHAGALELEVALTVDKSRLKWAVVTDVKEDTD